MISELDREEIKRISAECYNDLGMFGKVLLPEAFYTNYSELHLQILRALDSKHRKIAIAAPRGLGKTTIARAAVIRGILYRDHKFISYVSNSATNAELQTENIKRELRSNEEIRRIFGDIAVSSKDPGIDDTFSKTAWVAFGETLVLPRGAHQQVRGLIYNNSRPQLIVVDDLEKREELDNPDNRVKLKDWFFGDLEKSINRYRDDWRIVYIDTLKHYDSLLQVLLDSDDWYSLRLDICDDNYNSKVPELFTTEELKAEAERHRKRGILDIFFMEYRNLPTSKETQVFHQEYFKYYEETDEDFKPNELENVVIVDPAKSVNMRSADSAIVGIGINYRTSAIYFRDCVNGKMYPDEVYEEMFNMRRRLNAHVVGIEVTGLEEFIKQPILNEMSKRGPIDVFEPVWLKARGGPADGEKGKIKRIGTLAPYYRQGYIIHNKNCCGPLESQLIPFPRSALLDVADSFAYIIELLELGERYFTSPAETEEEIEAEYASLDYDDPIEDWRLV